MHLCFSITFAKGSNFSYTFFTFPGHHDPLKVEFSPKGRNFLLEEQILFYKKGG